MFTHTWNRVTLWTINGVEKKNGEIIDYYNVFRNMRKALKDYAQGMTFCGALRIDLAAVLNSNDVFKNGGTFDAYADKLLTKDEWRKGFAVYENTIASSSPKNATVCST